MASLKRFIQDDRGLETVEWVVIAAMITTGLIAVTRTTKSLLSWSQEGI
jgi:Flp pilus assembly pilin Flp